MKKFIVPLVMIAAVAVIFFAGCMPGAPPEPAPPEPAPPEEEWVEGGYWRLPLNPYKGLAVKADGTPFTFAISYLFLENDWCSNQAGFFRSLIRRAGAELIEYDCALDVDKQIAFIDDLIATRPPDGLVIHAVNEAQLAPSVDKATAAGVPCFAFDFDVFSDNLVAYTHHWMDGPYGSNVCGELFVEIAEETGEHQYILELWGDKSNESFQSRHRGFNSAVEGHPLITVIESPECFYHEELAAEIVMDAFTAHPELNGVYVQGGGAAGSIEGLRSIGRLVPLGEPGHVRVFNNDCDRIMAKAMDDGLIDAVGSHYSSDLTDVIVKLMYTNVILGQPVVRTTYIPMKVLTPETIDAEAGLILGAPIGSRLPAGDFDKWPVFDSTEGVFDMESNPVPIPAPTVELRQQYQGY